VHGAHPRTMLRGASAASILARVRSKLAARSKLRAADCYDAGSDQSKMRDTMPMTLLPSIRSARPVSSPAAAGGLPFGADESTRMVQRSAASAWRDAEPNA
jgi:hypothetical protein